MCLRTGIRGKSAVDLARELIARFGGLAGLLGADLPELVQVKGLGAAKARATRGGARTRAALAARRS